MSDDKMLKISVSRSLMEDGSILGFDALHEVFKVILDEIKHNMPNEGDYTFKIGVNIVDDRK